MGLVHFNFLPRSLGYHVNVRLILPVDLPEGGSPPRAGEAVVPLRTLYLLHGGGGNSLDWLRFTNIERYAERHRLAVVMPEVEGSCFYSDQAYGQKYFTYVSEELPLAMECLSPLSRRREDRFVAGLSMGGYGAFKLAFRKPGSFAAAANFSGISFIADIFKAGAIAGDENGRSIVEANWGSLEALEGSLDDTRFLVDRAAREKASLPRLFAGIGIEDYGYRYTIEFLGYAREKGLDIAFEEVPGGHDWVAWDRLVERFIEFIYSD
jgi:putative tributyrin esterase